MPQGDVEQPDRPGSQTRRRRAAPLAGRDRELLEFLAEHRFVTRPHVQALLDISDGAAYRRLRGLVEHGLVRFEKPLGRLPPCYRITRRGLAAIGSTMSPPRPVDLASYAHDLGVAWLFVAARSGCWGEPREVLSERYMRSYDASAERLEQIGGPGEPFALRLRGFGQAGRERLHYPDLVLVDRDGHRIAVELELTSKGRSRRERIVAAYAGDRRFDAVLYLVDRSDVGRLVERSASRLGVAEIVHVQPFGSPPDAATPPTGRAVARNSQRARAGSDAAGAERE